MYEMAKNGTRQGNERRRKQNLAPRTLLIVVPSDSLSSCYDSAIENEFPWIDVVRLASLEEACQEFEHPVPLILVEPADLDSLEKVGPLLRAAHPAAMTVLMYDNDSPSISCESVLASQVLRGVLPMNLRLDIWLSVVDLMLRGGEYFPAWFLQRDSARLDVHADPVGDSANGVSVHSDTPDCRFDNLTEREEQVLGMLSQGMQNKIIANELNLSENTVKIHIHNITKKLGAHNRTEAAALFHRRKEQRLAVANAKQGLAQRLPRE